MIRHTKSAKRLYLYLYSKSHLFSHNSSQKLIRILPGRPYSKDGRFTAGDGDVWRKTSSTNTQATNRKSRLPRSHPTKPQYPDEVSTPDICRSTLNVDNTGVIGGRRTISAVHPATKLESSDCVILPHTCPPPSLTPVGISTQKGCPDIKQLEEQTKSTEHTPSCSSAKENVTILKAAEESKKVECPPTSSPSLTSNETSSGSSTASSGSPGGDKNSGSSKWIWSILAVTLGGGLAYYVFWTDKDKKDEGRGKTKKFSGQSRRLTPTIAKFPPTSEDLPKEVKYLLIGGGTASFSAFRSIKSLNPKAEVLVLAKESEFPYMRPPLSKEMWNSNRAARENLMFKQWNGSVRSVYFEPDSFYMEPKALSSSSKGGVSVARGWEVTSIDAANKQVTLDDGSVISYEKCLLAPGSKPKSLPLLENVDKSVMDKVFYFRDVFDFRDLSQATECGRDIVVIGGGFLGSELSSSLTHQGCRVTQVFRESGLLAKLLPSYLSKWLTTQVRDEGVNILSETEVVEISSISNKLSFTLSNGEKLQSDYCVVATGAVPNTDLAASSKLEIHPTLGGYLVNSEMLARSNLYIAGDAACFYDERFGRRRVEHHDHAVVSGRLAGENMVGAGKPYVHISMLWSDLSPDIGWESVGILDPKLETTGVFAFDTKTKEEKVPETTLSIQQAKEGVPVPPEHGVKRLPDPGEQFNKGVVFYLKDGVIVGILLWNVFNRMELARRILKQECKYDDLNEVAKLFQIHAD